MESMPLIEPVPNWMKVNYTYCPKCGSTLGRRLIRVSEPAQLVCNACGFVFFLDPKVAVGTIVPLDGRILLVKRAIEPDYGKWVFPGGFVDRGERVEEAAIRETREESNLLVRVARLLNVYSYPDYPVIVIVFVAEPVGGQVSAGDETLEASTFPPETIPWDDLGFPSTAQALRDYLQRDKGGHGSHGK